MSLATGEPGRSDSESHQTRMRSRAPKVTCDRVPQRALERTGCGLRMRKASFKAGLGQIAVAKKLKRMQSYVSRVEAGEQRLDILELKRFAKLYNKDINYFV